MMWRQGGLVDGATGRAMAASYGDRLGNRMSFSERGIGNEAVRERCARAMRASDVPSHVVRGSRCGVLCADTVSGRRTASLGACACTVSPPASPLQMPTRVVIAQRAGTWVCVGTQSRARTQLRASEPLCARTRRHASCAIGVCRLSARPRALLNTLSPSGLVCRSSPEIAHPVCHMPIIRGWPPPPLWSECRSSACGSLHCMALPNPLSRPSQMSRISSS